MQDCISTYFPSQSPSSSFCVLHHFPSLGLTKQLIYLSLLFVHNKTQSTEATKKLENKSKELLIFLTHIHVAHTIKSINPKGERITKLFLLTIYQEWRLAKYVTSTPITTTHKTAASPRKHYQALIRYNLVNSVTLPQQNIFFVVQVNRFQSNSPSLL